MDDERLIRSHLRQSYYDKLRRYQMSALWNPKNNGRYMFTEWALSNGYEIGDSIAVLDNEPLSPKNCKIRKATNKYKRIPGTCIKDLTGMTFGRLKVLGLYSRKKNHAIWKCQCSCKDKTIVYLNGSALTTGNTKSCGCLQRERSKQAHTKHGLSHSALYLVHASMIKRCYNKNASDYQHYGGRGIYICDEWYTPNDPNNTGFVNFYNWAILHGYEKGLSIDRIDNDGPYAPWNCRFVTQLEQMNNNSRNVKIYDDNELLSLSEFYRKYKIHNGYFYRRYNSGWSISAIVYDVKNRNLGIRKINKQYYDKDGFIVLIPEIKVAG